MQLSPYDNLMQDVSYWIQNFLASKESEGVSPHTIEQYRRVLYNFEDFISAYAEDMGIESINKMTIEFYLNDLRSKNRSAGTIKTHFSILKTFFRYITENNDELKDYTKIFERIKLKTDKKVRETLTNEEVERLIRYCEHKQNESQKDMDYRNTLLIKLLLETGMRSSSLLSLRFEDFEVIEYEGIPLYKIKIIQKGQKENYVYAEKSVIEEEYERWLRHFNYKRDTFIASTASGKPLTRKQLYNIVTNLLEKIGIHKKGVHIFRHTFVRIKREQGVDLSTIQALLGHSSITTTINIYGKAGEEDKIRSALPKPKK